MTVVEVFADIVCPFTHVGLRRFVQRRDEEGRTDVSLLVRAWPLEIVNGQPLDPAATVDKVAALRDQVAPDLFAGFDEHTFPRTSMPALALAHAAYRVGLGPGEAVSLALRDALFEHGADLTDPAVLRQIADDHGVQVERVDEDAVLRDHAEGVERGVIGSPHFFTAAGDFFCPSLDIEHDAEGHLQISLDVERLDGFLAACFR